MKITKQRRQQRQSTRIPQLERMVATLRLGPSSSGSSQETNSPPTLTTQRRDSMSPEPAAHTIVDAEFRALRELHPTIAGMERGLRDYYFAKVFHKLQLRASGDYERQTIDTLEFLERHICDSKIEMIDGEDVAHSQWIEMYGERFKKLRWTFNSLKDYVQFGYRFIATYPELWCTIKTRANFKMEAEISSTLLSRNHDRCQKIEEGIPGCEICTLHAILNQSSNSIVVVDKKSDMFSPDTWHRYVLDGVTTIVRRTWWTLDREVVETHFQISGRMGEVFASTDFYQWKSMVGLD